MHDISDIRKRRYGEIPVQIDVLQVKVFCVGAGHEILQSLYGKIGDYLHGKSDRSGKPCRRTRYPGYDLISGHLQGGAIQKVLEFNFVQVMVPPEEGNDRLIIGEQDKGFDHGTCIDSEEFGYLVDCTFFGGRDPLQRAGVRMLHGLDRTGFCFFHVRGVFAGRARYDGILSGIRSKRLCPRQLYSSPQRSKIRR